MKQVGQGVRKKDAMALLCGKPVYTQDLAPAECLCVKLLRSPHANAIIRQIDASAARRMPGVACVLTHEDAPRSRFTLAGQTYPEPSPYDRLILDRHVRHVGDPVAIVAAESERAAEAALRRIRVQYEVLPAVLDAEQALDHPVLVHPEDDWKALCDVGADNRRNLCASGCEEEGNVDEINIGTIV